jgi:diguanylate cyclase (GGDEF)-like protein/PAS domain S-box-containing protein
MSNARIRSALLIEDNPGDARLLREMLRGQDIHRIELTHVDSMGAAELVLAQRDVDVILLDLGLPDAEGLDAVRRTRVAAPHTPLVILTGLNDESIAVRTLHAGAQDYLVKGEIETRGLMRSLRYAIERKQLKEALFEEKERAQVTLASIGDAVICTSSAGVITFLNVVAERLTGWSWSEAVGVEMSEVFRLRGEIIDGVPRPPHMVLIRRDGVEIAVEESIAPIHDRHGHETGAVVVFRDVSAARAMARDLLHSARHDVLTGLPNRFTLNDRLGQAIALARRRSTSLAVLYLDLDGFKHINDSLGHTFGDKLLRSVSERIVGCARRTDTVSRQGGDEFVVLLSETSSAEDAAIAARRMLQAVAAPHTIEDHELHLTTSIGISVYPDDGADAGELLRSADIAMYQAKENGRSNYQFFKPDMNKRAMERHLIEEHLRRAIERDQLSLHFQPKIDFRTGAIVGAEALLRWTHPTRGAVGPAQFIPVAEACGLIVPIGRWVLRRACAQARAWIDAGLPVGTMAVNVSAIEFRDRDFLAVLFATLAETGLDPTLLQLELTESVLMKQPESAAKILATLRDRGVQVAVDDFGTGYSSLSYLRRFPIDALKIDQSFVGHICTTPDDASIVTAVIGMAQSLRLRVIAEGVETHAQMAFLQAHACDEAQGYYFSRPMPALQYADLLAGSAPFEISLAS